MKIIFKNNVFNVYSSITSWTRLDNNYKYLQSKGTIPFEITLGSI